MGMDEEELHIALRRHLLVAMKLAAVVRCDGLVSARISPPFSRPEGEKKGGGGRRPADSCLPRKRSNFIPPDPNLNIPELNPSFPATDL